ncbi:MAG TPA: glycosyltransferase family 2 protein [Acidimicrobiales bacterium]|nr:glycosyltransferase family 2 protein [Acidimicrobiales bacterium]
MTDRAPRVSVVIVNWNARQALLDCLASLEASPPAAAWEAIVVDNGSGDGSVAAVSAAHPSARVIANATNRGLPAANNQAMAVAAGEVLLICNPDVVFAPGAAAALVEVLDRRPRAGMVIPRLRYPDGGVQTSAGDLPTLGQALRGRQAQRRRHQSGADPPAGFWWDGWAHDEERAIGRGHEAAYVVRRVAVEEVGPQDEGFRLDWEGIDWTARFRDAGWEIWFCPAADVVHLGGASIRQVPFRWVVWSHVGMYRYFAKRRRRAWRPALAAVIAARAAVKLVVTAAGVAMYERAHRGRHDVAGSDRGR